jgi:hypothetical protein
MGYQLQKRFRNNYSINLINVKLEKTGVKISKLPPRLSAAFQIPTSPSMGLFTVPLYGVEGQG